MRRGRVDNPISLSLSHLFSFTFPSARHPRGVCYFMPPRPLFLSLSLSTGSGRPDASQTRSSRDRSPAVRKHHRYRRPDGILGQSLCNLNWRRVALLIATMVRWARGGCRRTLHVTAASVGYEGVIHMPVVIWLPGALGNTNFFSHNSHALQRWQFVGENATITLTSVWSCDHVEWRGPYVGFHKTVRVYICCGGSADIFLIFLRFRQTMDNKDFKALNI